MNLFTQLNQALEFTELKLSNRKNFYLTHCLPILIDYWTYSLYSFLGKSLFHPHEPFLFVSLSVVSGKLAFLHDDYIATIENCCAPMVVKCVMKSGTHV